MPQNEQLASTPEPLLPKGKGTEPSLKIVKRERVKVSESRTLARKRGIKAEAEGGKGELQSKGKQVPRRKEREDCTNQLPPQSGGTVPAPLRVKSKWLLAFPRVPVTPGTSLEIFLNNTKAEVLNFSQL